MSVSPNEILDPAHRTSEGTTHNNSSRLQSQKQTSMSSWNGKILANVADKDDSDNCLPNEELEKIERCESNCIGHRMEENRVSQSSSNSSASFGSLGDVPSSQSNHGSLHDSSYLPAVDANLPLEVINPILDLVDDDDDAFGMPLSQQDEKLLEELLR